jgi:hypothetical protein
MNDTAPIPLAAVAVLATSAGLLPERLDLTHIFAAYGAGAIVGEAVAARLGKLDPATAMRRYGAWTMGVAAFLWLLALITALP